MASPPRRTQATYSHKLLKLAYGVVLYILERGYFFTNKSKNKKMKYIYIFVTALFLFSCTDQANEVANLEQIEEAKKAQTRFDFFQSIGYHSLSPEHNADKMVAHYIETNETYPGHEFLNQYNLNVIDQLMRFTEYSSTITQADLPFVKAMYENFRGCKSGLKAKYLMLNALSKNESSEYITTAAKEAVEKSRIHIERMSGIVEKYKDTNWETETDNLVYQSTMENLEESKTYSEKLNGFLISEK